jgi:uncharacterized SAM-binding protein YcdF (DUF218 family)
VIKRAVARMLGAPLTCEDAVGPADAIVILGAPLREGGVLTDVLVERVATGYALWRDGAAPIVCVTGGPSRGTTEAAAMAAALRTLGIPDDALRIEPAARSTAQNATRTAALLAPEGVRTICLVTQPFHLRRSRLLFRRAGFEVRPVRIVGGLQDRTPERALKWVLREYGAWGTLLLGRVK